MSDAREKLVDILEQAIDVVASASFPGSCGREVTSIDNPRETAHAALSAIEAAGVRLVPSEVTEKMLDAPMSTGTASNVWQAANIYRAMLAASPYAQKEQTHESD